jgi:hypothetical protein
MWIPAIDKQLKVKTVFVSFFFGGGGQDLAFALRLSETYSKIKSKEREKKGKDKNEFYVRFCSAGYYT